ncbi:MetQ/NlpA family ABC transporter substrate-binding protein [Microbacterium sp.]|uniref:MetQ/NlpA family ABC transporter substrate-binding protein n=1 Tax=Microbacterium sp. TaxID=51671 RepID=UPI003A9404BE
MTLRPLTLPTTARTTHTTHTARRTARVRTIAALAAASLLLLTGCAGTATGADDTKTIKVAATVTPMTDAVEAAADVIGDGYKIELVPVSDYVQPNVLLQHKEIDANLVQFPGFMQEFNDKNGADLVAVQPVYSTVVAFYSKKHKSLDDVPDGGSIVIPNDKSNAARALQLLVGAHLITLKDGTAPFTATMDDIASNPRHLKLTQVDLLQLNTAYDEADAVFDLPSFARQLGLTPERDGLAVEKDPRFAVTLVARADNEKSAAIAALVKAITSDHVRAKLESLGVPPAF